MLGIRVDDCRIIVREVKSAIKSGIMSNYLIGIYDKDIVMSAGFINIGLGFLEGIGLILSPCILPILPIILAGSLTESKRRPFGIIIGFILVFTLFTFFSRQLIQALGINADAIRYFSYAALFLLGLIMISSYLSEKFSVATQRLANTGSSLVTTNNEQGGLWSGIIFGSLIALIWTPCAGPILAAVIVQTIIQRSDLMGFLTIAAFGIGAAVPMLIIALFGREIIAKFGYLKSHTTMLRKFLGAIIILSVLYMIYADKAGSLLSNTKTVATSISTPAVQLINPVEDPYTEPKIAGIEAWINSAPLQLSDLKGKVVLIDFWTYSCINCIRTFPYLKDWYNKYHDKGLVIIGIHSPEFEFEKNLDNVKNAVAQYQIPYPVALDNQFTTWQNFQNKYWPAHFLINKEGEVVYIHNGEGEYETTENNIRFLLGMTEKVKTPLPEKPVTSANQTPETYLGYARAENFKSVEPMTNDVAAKYTPPKSLALNEWALEGRWKVLSDHIVSDQVNAKLQIHFRARKVFMVMGNMTNQPITAQLMLNNKPLGIEKGKDIVDSKVKVDKHNLYEVISFENTSEGILTITANAPGLEIYTFTFGE